MIEKTNLSGRFTFAGTSLTVPFAVAGPTCVF